MTTFAEITKRVRRSATSGERLHLEPAHARALMNPRVYALLSALEAEELEQSWADDKQKAPPRASKSADSGSHGDANATNGASHGTTLAQVAGVSEALASEAARPTVRPKKHVKPSPVTILNPPAPRLHRLHPIP